MKRSLFEFDDMNAKLAGQGSWVSFDFDEWSVVLPAAGDGSFPTDKQAGWRLVGDRWIPERFVIEYGYRPGPLVQMVVYLFGDEPTCISLQLITHGPAITQKDLRDIVVADWVRLFVDAIAMTSPSTSRDVPPRVVINKSAIEAAIASLRRGTRRTLDDDLLKRVASAYTSGETHGIEAVIDAFDVSKSTAVRYIKAARAAGYIEGRKR
jgi:hypothetical protein